MSIGKDVPEREEKISITNQQEISCLKLHLDISPEKICQQANREVLQAKGDKKSNSKTNTTKEEDRTLLGGQQITFQDVKKNHTLRAHLNSGKSDSWRSMGKKGRIKRGFILGF